MKTEKTKRVARKKATENEVANDNSKTLNCNRLIEKKTLESGEVTQASLASLLGLAASNVMSLTNAGSLTKNENGNFDLVESVRKYVKDLRERKTGAGKSTLETEALKLKNEKQKTYIESWRRKRDKQIAVGILEALKTAMLRLKTEIENGVKINDAIENVITSLQTVDYDVVLEEVENMDNDEEEE